MWGEIEEKKMQKKMRGLDDWKAKKMKKKVSTGILIARTG